LTEWRWLINISEWAGSNNHRMYAVNIIDCFSKYAWLLLIIQKKVKKVLEVLGPFLKESTPKILQSDNSGKFTKACMKELLSTSASITSLASYISLAATDLMENEELCQHLHCSAAPFNEFN